MPASEQHRTVQEIASIWGLSAHTVRELFRSEPGVLKKHSPECIRAHKRGYTVLRIPDSVVRRVHERMSK